MVTEIVAKLTSSGAHRAGSHFYTTVRHQDHAEHCNYWQFWLWGELFVNEKQILAERIGILLHFQHIAFSLTHCHLSYKKLILQAW